MPQLQDRAECAASSLPARTRNTVHTGNFNVLPQCLPRFASTHLHHDNSVDRPSRVEIRTIAHTSDAAAMLRKQASSPLSPTEPQSHPFASKKRRQPGGGYLPLHRRRRTSFLGVSVGVPRSPQARRRALLALAILLSLLWALYWILTTYEFQFEMSVYSRRWVRQEFDEILPLKGCFDNPSPSYNMTQPSHLLSPGITLRRGMSCYDFASTVAPAAAPEELLYHTYWRTDLRSFGPRQAATIEAFLASQPHAASKLILWSNGAEALRSSPHVRPFLDEWASVFEVRQADLAQLAVGTDLDGMVGSVYDSKGWVDGDALRLLLLWHYGGVWMDMDMLLVRDLHTLAETEFVGQWDCYGASLSPDSSLPLLSLLLLIPFRSPQTNPTSR